MKVKLILQSIALPALINQLYQEILTEEIAASGSDEDIDSVYIKNLSKEALLDALDAFLRDENKALDEPIYWHLVDVLTRIQHFYVNRPDVVYESIEFTGAQDLLLNFSLGAQ